MKVVNRANLASNVFEAIAQEIEKHRSLLDILKWAREQPPGDLLPEILSDLVVQDEFNHDVVIPWKNLYFVYETTCLGSVTAIAIWDHRPTADELLTVRLNEGWRPTPSKLKDGDRVIGHAACLER
ncbi:MAG: hypothetical protein ACRD4B_03550 [Acidobacteriota bacterium]